MSPWYEDSFGEDYLLVYKHRSYEQAEREIASILPLIQLHNDDRVLDLCCGTGRHAIALAKRGFDVTGLDLSDTLLKRARQESGHFSVRYIQGDMRELPFPNRSFDAVVNLFTSFGYFLEDADNAQVLREINRVLQPEGRFLIDFLNRAHVEKNLQPLTNREENGAAIREERQIDDHYVKKTITVTENGHSRTYRERVKMYSLEEMEAMCVRSGLHVEHVFGDYSGKAYDENTPRMILMGRR